VISTGNDIVALGSPDIQRAGQSRFYSKILSLSEQSLYLQPKFAQMPFEHFVWLLWSVKESAYKYLKRVIHDLVFSPAKIVIQSIEIPLTEVLAIHSNTEWDNNADSESFYSGRLVYGTHHFYFRSKINLDWIVTVVNGTKRFDNVFWGIQKIDEVGHYHQSKAARALVLKKLKGFFHDILQIEKNPVGYPEILKGCENMYIPVSLAHDGRFVAYSFILNSK